MMTHSVNKLHASNESLGKVIFVSASAAMSGFLFGYDTAVINGAVLGIQGHFHISSLAVGIIVSTALLGCAVGAMTAGKIAENYGRRTVMRVAAVLFLISALGSMYPIEPWLLAVWRIVGGIAIGAASVIGPLYIAEVSPPAYRGRLSSLQQLAIVVGIALSQLVNYFIAHAAGDSELDTLAGLEAWQWMLGACAIPALVYFLLATRIPESPRFYVSNGQLEEARAVFAELEGPTVDLDSRVAEVRSALATEHKPQIKEVLSKSTLFLPVVWVGIGLAVFQQFIGINVIFYYSSVLWQSVGEDQQGSLLRSFSTAMINLVGTFVAIALIDKIGRKILLIVGSAGMTAALAVEAWAFGQAHTINEQVSLPETAGLAALLAAHVYVFFFALSWGVGLWVLMGEIFPSRLRATAISVSTASNWCANWLITVSFPVLADWNLSLTYAGYALFSAVSLIFVRFCVTETKGKRLEEI